MRTSKILETQPQLGLLHKTVADITLHNIDLATKGIVYKNEPQCSAVVFLAILQYLLSSGVNRFSLGVRTKILGAQPELALPHKTVADITLHNIDLATKGIVYNNEPQCSPVVFLARLQNL